MIMRPLILLWLSACPSSIQWIRAQEEADNIFSITQQQLLPPTKLYAKILHDKTMRTQTNRRLYHEDGSMLVSWRNKIRSGKPLMSFERYKEEAEFHYEATQPQLEESLRRELQNNAARTICNHAITQEEEVGKTYGTKCNCTPNVAENTMTLECIDMDCVYCNKDESVCEQYSYGVLFDRQGNDVALFEKDDFMYGLSGSVLYTERESDCEIEVDGETCSSCTMIVCKNGYYGLSVQCNNLVEGGDFDSCDAGYSLDGAFQAFDEGEFDTCLTSADACQRDGRDLDPKHTCDCREQTNGSDKSILYCNDFACEYCNADASVCATAEYEQMYSKGVTTATKQTLTYTLGLSAEIVYERLGCNAVECERCSFKVDGEQCKSCILKSCLSGEKTPMVDCENVHLGGKMDMCEEQTFHDSIFDFFSIDFGRQCTSKGEKKCLEEKKYYESNDRFVCSCLFTPRGSSKLSCQMMCGDVCNQETTVCARESISKEFSSDGIQLYYQKDMQYTVGRFETLVYVEIGDSCKLRVNGTPCQGCTLHSCGNSGVNQRAPHHDCSNIESGAIFDLCDESLKVMDGAFELFSVDAFEDCVTTTPYNDASQATANPEVLHNLTTIADQIKSKINSTQEMSGARAALHQQAQMVIFLLQLNFIFYRL